MRISGAESVVMKALWRIESGTAEDVADAIADERAWSTATIKTLLNRLLTKKAVTAVLHGRRYIYAPRLKEADYVQEESRGLLDRLFGGKVAPLVSHFAETKQLSPEDIAELKRLIAELDDDG